MRLVLALVVVAVMGCAIVGIGMGSAPAERERAPSAAAVAAARARIQAGGGAVRRGRELFTAEGCDRCHSIAAIGAEGKLGPRLDTIDEDAEEILDSIRDPRDDIVDGYPENLMADDYAKRLSSGELQALAAFVAAAAGGEGDEDSGGRGRGRGRGRGGSD